MSKTLLIFVVSIVAIVLFIIIGMYLISTDTNNKPLGANAPGTFFQPEGVAVNSTGFIYVADTQNDRIQIFHKNAKTSPIPFDVNWKLIAQKSKDLSGRVLVQQILKVAIHEAMLNDLAVISNVEVLEIIGRIQNEKHISHYA